MEDEGTEVTWAVLRINFQERYFLEDVHSKKELEFLRMNKGNLTNAEYAAKFKEVVKFCPHYNSATAEGLKCIKFKSDLRPEIKKGIGYQETHMFFMLVNKCKIYDEDNGA